MRRPSLFRLLATAYGFERSLVGPPFYADDSAAKFLTEIETIDLADRTAIAAAVYGPENAGACA